MTSTPPRRRLDGMALWSITARSATAAFSPRKDLVKNYAPDSLFDLLTGDAYTAKMEKVYSQGCDPVTGAPNLDYEPMQPSTSRLPSSGLTGTEHNPLPPAHHMPTY